MEGYEPADSPDTVLPVIGLTNGAWHAKAVTTTMPALKVFTLADFVGLEAAGTRADHVAHPAGGRLGDDLCGSGRRQDARRHGHSLCGGVRRRVPPMASAQTPAGSLP